MQMSARKVNAQIITLWKRLLEHHPTCSELGDVIKNIPSLREAAARELLSRQDISQNDLLVVMRYCDEMRIAAWDKFVLRNPSEIHLRYVIENISPLAETAGRILLGRFPTKNFLFCMMERVSLLRHEAWEQYCDQIPTREELCWVIRYIPTLAHEAGKMLLRQNPSNIDLRCVMVKIEGLASEAGKMLLRQKPSRDDIQCVLDHVPDLKEEAARMLVRQVSTIELENLIATYGSLISEPAGIEFGRRTRKLSLADKEYIHSHALLLTSEIERCQDTRLRADILEKLLALGKSTS